MPSALQYTPGSPPLHEKVTWPAKSSRFSGQNRSQAPWPYPRTCPPSQQPVCHRHASPMHMFTRSHTQPAQALPSTLSARICHSLAVHPLRGFAIPWPYTLCEALPLPGRTLSVWFCRAIAVQYLPGSAGPCHRMLPGAEITCSQPLGAISAEKSA